jgi:hypothetical protein
MRARDRYPASRYPLSDQLCAFMDVHPEFHESLKLHNTKRFHFLRCILSSGLPSGEHHADDEVIGLWYLDKQNLLRLSGDRARAISERRPFFKQDFIVNVGSREAEYVSYTAESIFEQIQKKIQTPYIRLIDDFFLQYGKGGAYYHNGLRWQHEYPDVEDLPAEKGLRDLARQARDHCLTPPVE